MLSRFSPRTYSMRSFSIALCFFCAGCGFGFLALLGSIDTVRASSNLVPHTALYHMSADGSGLKRLADDPQHGLWGPAWSPDGKHIVVTFEPLAVNQDERNIRGQLYLLDADGQNVRQLTHNERNNYLVEWSHDGKKLAFVSQQGKHTETAEIYTINADGSDERRLTNNAVWDYGATWSPDDQQIAFGSNMGGNWQIWLMNVDGSNQRPLPNPAHGNAPKWSPDGRFMVLKSDREGNDNLYVMEPDGSNQQNVTQNSSINTMPSWSPDSLKIVFSSDREGTPNIYTMNRDGSDLVNLTRDSGLDAQLPTWSPDGKQIIFAAEPLETGIAAYLGDNAGMLLGALIGVLALVTLLVFVWRRRNNLSRAR